MMCFPEQRSSLRGLHSRVSDIQKYLVDVAAGTMRLNHQIIYHLVPKTCGDNEPWTAMVAPFQWEVFLYSFFLATNNQTIYFILVSENMQTMSRDDE